MQRTNTKWSQVILLFATHFQLQTLSIFFSRKLVSAYQKLARRCLGCESYLAIYLLNDLHCIGISCCQLDTIIHTEISHSHPSQRMYPNLCIHSLRILAVQPRVKYKNAMIDMTRGGQVIGRANQNQMQRLVNSMIEFIPPVCSQESMLINSIRKYDYKFLLTIRI